MCGCIDRALQNILKKLREYYIQPNIADDMNETQVTVTFAENNLDHGIHVGTFSLFSENLKTISNYCATRLWDYLKAKGAAAIIFIFRGVLNFSWGAQTLFIAFLLAIFSTFE